MPKVNQICEAENGDTIVILQRFFHIIQLKLNFHTYIACISVNSPY